MTTDTTRPTSEPPGAALALSGHKTAVRAMVDQLLYRGPLQRPDWRLASRALDGEGYAHRSGRLTLIWSVGRELDGHDWLHISVAGRDRLPTWAELVEAKEWLVGRNTYAYQVVPPRSRYVNQHEFALHLFVPIDAEPLPDFARGTDHI